MDPRPNSPRSRPTQILISFVIVFALTGCVDPSRHYIQPAHLTPDTAATIVGSKIAKSDAFVGDTRAWLVGVDGKATMTLRHGWDSPWLVEPGPRTIAMAMERGRMTMLNNLGERGASEVKATLEAGKKYVIRIDNPEGMPRLWLESDSGTPASEKVAVTLATPRSSTVIPVYVPRK
jgi:hypothetical protein